MANLAKIQTIKDGEFYVKVNNTLTKLYEGDIVNLNDTIVSAKSNGASAKMDILLDTHEVITINNQGEVKLDTSLFETTFKNEELAFSSNSVDDSFSAWSNAQGNIDNMETAAGEEDSNSEDGGAFVGKFDQRDNREVRVSADYDERSALSLNEASIQNNDNEILADLLNIVPETQPETPPPLEILSRVRISGSHVNEDADNHIPTFNKVIGQVTLELDEAFSEDVYVTIKNETTGKEQNVLIKAGETKVVVNVETSRIDDEYKQGDTTEVITIVKVSNPQVGISFDKAEITISDDNDWDTIHREFTMDGSVVAEGGKNSVTGKKVIGYVTIEVSKAFEKDVEIIIKNEETGKEQTVMLLKGETEVIAAVETSRVDDIYKQGATEDKISIIGVRDPISKISAPKQYTDFDNVTADISILDDKDQVNANITQDTNVKASSGNVGFDIKLDNKPQGAAKVKVEVSGKEYEVNVDANGNGKLQVPVKDLGDLSNTPIMIMENITDTVHEEISTDEKNSMNSNGKFKVNHNYL